MMPALSVLLWGGVCSHSIPVMWEQPSYLAFAVQISCVGSSGAFQSGVGPCPSLRAVGIFQADKALDPHVDIRCHPLVYLNI